MSRIWGSDLTQNDESDQLFSNYQKGMHRVFDRDIMLEQSYTNRARLAA
jgi:hypothetical protein